MGKVILALLLLLSLMEVKATPCLSLLEIVITSDAAIRFKNIPLEKRISLLNEARERKHQWASDDHKRQMEFITDYSRPLLLREDFTPKSIWVNGRIGRILNRTENKGIENVDIIFHSDETKVVKLLGIKAVPELLTETYYLSIAERSGGLRLLGFGQTYYEGKPCLFIEMEKAFAGEKTFTLKDLLFENNNKSYKLVSRQFFSTQKKLEDSAKAVARKFWDFFRVGIMPLDPDMVLTDGAKVAWIDVALWDSATFNEKNLEDLLYPIASLQESYSQFNKEFLDLMYRNFIELVDKSSYSDLQKRQIKEIFSLQLERSDRMNLN